MKYQIIVVSKMNCGKAYSENVALAGQLSNVEMYTLTDKVHPNTYEDNFDRIEINIDEFTRLLADTEDQLDYSKSTI